MAAYPAPALKTRPSTGTKKAGLKWDEANLEQNEIIKKELPAVKITEPKTPYHAPLQGDLDDLEPLDLDGTNIKAGQHHVVNDKPPGDKQADFEAARRKHYSKEALAAARKAVEEEEDEDE